MSGGGEQPRLPPLLASTKFMTLLPVLALLPVSASAKDAVSPVPSPVSRGAPGSGAGEGAAGVWRPAGVSLPLLLGSGVAVPPGSRPGGGGPEGATAAQDERSGAAADEGSETPQTEPSGPSRRFCNPAAREATEAPTEIASTPPVLPGQPVTDTAEPGLAWLPTRSATSGEEQNVATVPAELAQPLTPVQNSARMVGGSEGLSEGPEASEGVSAEPKRMPGSLPRSESPEPWTAVGPFRPGTATPPTPVPPTSSKSLSPWGTITEEEEVVIRDSSAGSTVTSSVPSASVRETQQDARALAEAPTSPSSAAPPAGRREEVPHSSSSSSSFGAISSPPCWRGSSSHNPCPATSLGVEPSAGPWTPSPSLPTGLGWLTPDSPEGASWHSRGEMDPPQSGPGPLAFSDTAPTPGELLLEDPFATLGEEGGTLPGPPEPFSPPSARRGDLAQLTSRPTQLPPSWLTKGDPFASRAPDPTEASTGPGAPTDSVKSPGGSPSPPAERATKRGAPQRAGEGAQARTVTETAETLTGRTPGRVSEAAGRTPTPAEWLAGSPVASRTAEEGVPSSSPSRDPELLSKVATFSSPAPDSAAEPASERGRTAVPDHPSATQQPWTSSARTRSWERGSRPSGPPEEVTLLPRRSGTFQTSSAGGPGGSWHAWPPVPAPDPGSIAREEPPAASTWLLASVPEGAATAKAPPVPVVPREWRPRAHPVFVVENQPPLLKATLLHIPCELVLAMEFSRSFQNPQSPEYQSLVVSINETVSPLLASLPGFRRLEVKTIRPGSVVVEFDALFLAQTPGLWAALNRSSLSERLQPGLRVANASVLRTMTWERHLDLCAVLFSCHAGYECVAEEGIGSATCTSMCHRDYCKNQGICTHATNHTPVCRCPVGSDFWFLGVRCDYRVTRQGVLAVSCGLLLSLVVIGVAVAGLVIRRVRLLLLEARVDQTKSSYRRFCRLDDVSAHYWSEPWLASASSLDNPAFSNSEELLHLQILDAGCYSCQEESLTADGYRKQPHDTPCVATVGRPSSRYPWDESSNSANDPMIDSGKASEVSVSSWPTEPIQWSPFPGLHRPPREQAQKAPRPLSCCEGVEMVNLERSWTA